MLSSPWTNDVFTDASGGLRVVRELFDRYRTAYFPRSRRLRRFSIECRRLQREFGLCDYGTRALFIDVERHRSDKELRGTVLHEMIHAAVGNTPDTVRHSGPSWSSYFVRAHLSRLVFRNLASAVAHSVLFRDGFGAHGRSSSPCLSVSNERIAGIDGSLPTIFGGYSNKNVKMGHLRERSGVRSGAPQRQSMGSSILMGGFCRGQESIGRSFARAT
jgi:hypothetical protein